MSKQVDERVVSMKFDNKNFESNARTSISTIEKLKRSLNLSGAAKGLEEVDAAANNVKMGPLSQATEAVAMKFSALQVMAVTALSNITTSALIAGKRLVSAFTIDPVKTGLAEYETQINAVQTILANTSSKGTTLDQVNKALDELNHYADMTIYNFTEMTRNIGTFTAAGVDLDTSVSAIKGIANLAAVSGSTSQQASTAMYQLSQALAAGKVQLMDWNSVVNAGMGGQVFQDALKETARVNGVAIDDMIEKHGSFRETLQEGWLTSEILTKTLAKFTGDLSEAQLKEMGYTEEQIKEIIKLGQTANDAATKVKTFTQLMDTLKEAAQSGWTQSWEILIGDFEEAKKLWTSVSDYFSEALNNSAEARNSVLEGAMTTGWSQLLSKGISDEEGYKESIKAVAKEHGVSIDEMIKAEKKFDDSLDDSAAFQKALSKGLEDGSLTSDMLSKSVTKLADKMRGMSKSEREAAGYTDEHITQIESLESELKNGTISMEEFRKKITEPSGRENIIQSFSNAFKGLLSVIKPVKEAFREIFPSTTANQLYALTKRIRDFTANMKISEKTSENLRNTFKGVFALFDIGLIIIKDITSAVFGLAGGSDGLVSKLLAVTGSLGKFITKIRDTIKESTTFSNLLTKIADALKNVLGRITDVFTYIGKKFVTPGFNVFYTVLLGIWKVLKWVGGLVKDVLMEISEGIKTAFQNGDIASMSVGGGIVAILAMLLGTLKKIFGGLGDFFDNAAGFIDKIKGLFDTVGDALKTWQESLKAKTLLTIASAIGILAVSLVLLATIDEDKLTSSLLAITTLFAELMGSMAIFSKIAGEVTGVTKASFAMVSMSIAILILAGALKVIAGIKPDELKVALIGLVGVFVILLSAVTYMNKVLKTETQPQKLLGIAISLVVFAAALKILATMSLSDIGRSLLAMAGIFGLLLGLLATMAQIDKKGKGSKKLFGIAVSLVVFASALKILGSMSLEAIGHSLLAMAVVFGLLLGLLATMAQIDKKGRGTGSILVLANSLILIALALTIVGKMDWDAIKRSLVGISVVLGLMVGVLFSLSSLGGKAVVVAAALVVLAIAINLLVPALVALGLIPWENIFKSLGTLAVLFGLMVGAGYAMTPVIGTILAFAGALALIGVAVLAVGLGIVALSAGIAALAGAFAAGATAIVTGINTIIKGIIGLIPLIIVSIGEGIIGILNVIGGAGESIFNAVKAIVLALIKVLVECTPPLLKAIFVILEALLKEIVNFTPKLIDAVVKIILAILNGIAEKLPDIVMAAVNLVVSFIDGIIQSLPKAIDAGVRLVEALIMGITETIPRLVNLAFTSMITLLNGLADSIRENTPILIEAMNNLGSACMEALGMFIGNFTLAGGQLMMGLVKGIKQGVSKVVTSIVDGVKSAWNAALNWLGIHSPSTKGIEAGMYIDEGLAAGLTKYSDVAGDAATDVGKETVNSLSEALSEVSDVVDADMEIQPTIKPVVDLSNVKTSANEIDNMLDINPSIGAMSKANTISSSMNNNQNGDFDIVAAIKDIGKKISEGMGNTYTINGITYDDGSAVAVAVGDLVRATKIEGRI